MSNDTTSDVTIVNFKTVQRHPYVRAVADIQLHGLILRGIRIEQDSQGTLHLGFPGRKIRGNWQTLFEPVSSQRKGMLLEHLSQKLSDLKATA